MACDSYVYHLIFLRKNYKKKENKRKWLKVNNSIHFSMQKIKTIFKIRFHYDSLTPRFEESRLFTWSKKNGAINLLWDKDNHAMFTNRWQSDREGKRMFFKNIFKFYLYLQVIVFQPTRQSLTYHRHLSFNLKKMVTGTKHGVRFDCEKRKI